MSTETITATIRAGNVEKSVPFFGVNNMETSLRYYVDGLGFKVSRNGSSTAKFAGAGWILAVHP